MATYTTKFDPGEWVYVIHKNKPMCVIIDSVTISERRGDRNGAKVTYQCSRLGLDEGGLYDEKECFPTKEELLEHFKNELFK